MRHTNCLAFLLPTVSLVLVLSLGSGCQTSGGSSAYSPITSTLSTAPPRKVIIAPESTVTRWNQHVISRQTLVKELFSSLSTQPTEPFHHLTFIPPYSVLFVDARGDICAAFRYSMSSHPSDMFWPCEAERQGNGYVLGIGKMGLGTRMPGFAEKFSAILNFHDLEAPRN